MTNKVYEELPSGAIDYLELDYDLSNVKIIYKSNKNKQYAYKCKDLDEFQSAFMQLCGLLEGEQDRDDNDNLVEDVEDTIDREDFSIGKFINERIQMGNLTLDHMITQTPDKLDQGWDAFQGSTLPPDAIVVGEESGTP
tara:strand:+ start:220 stop:636 length:417 start_codon:yes stop_codon:yes gene_type:complete